MKTTFFVADDIQTLSDNKVMLVGLYPDSTLLIEPLRPVRPDQLTVLARLCMLVHVDHLPKGVTHVQPELKLPSGTPAPGISAIKLKSPKDGQAANLLCRFQPFPVPEFGRYTLEIQIGKERVVHEFFVRENQSRAPAKKRRLGPATKRVVRAPSKKAGIERRPGPSSTI